MEEKALPVTIPKQTQEQYDNKNAVHGTAPSAGDTLCSGNFAIADTDGKLIFTSRDFSVEHPDIKIGMHLLQKHIAESIRTDSAASGKGCFLRVLCDFTAYVFFCNNERASVLILYPASDIPALSQKLRAEQENGYISYGSVASMCEDKALTDAELKRLSSLFSSAGRISNALCAFFSEGVDADGTAPHKASGLLRAWQKCYSEASNKEGRCCEVVLEDDCCEYEYVRLNLEGFVGMLCAVCDYITTLGAKKIAVSLGRKDKSIIVKLCARTNGDFAVFNDISTLDEFLLAAEAAPPQILAAYGAAVKARSTLHCSRTLDGEMIFEIECRRADIGTLGFKSALPTKKLHNIICSMRTVYKNHE